MRRSISVISLIFLSFQTFCQQKAIDRFLSDSILKYASVSISVAETATAKQVIEFDADKSLIPASVLKLVTTAAALELLGPEYTFITTTGYTGSLNKRTGRLKGDLIIKGGGDPTLGSAYFTEFYRDFPGNIINDIKNNGVRKIDGRVITDDSYFDYNPIPGGWAWEDIGNYYGAGVYGLSVNDNTQRIHFNTLTDSSSAVITSITPELHNFETINRLEVSGKSDKGFAFSAPYSNIAWLEGTIPSGREDYILRASITDPPLLMAEMIKDYLINNGIPVRGKATSIRIEKYAPTYKMVPINSVKSPPLDSIIKVLNHESVNLYSEHLLKELGKKFGKTGSTKAGIEVVLEFLKNSGVNTDGIFIVDGSGLSPMNGISSKELTHLLIYMKNDGKFFPQYLNSLPDAGVEGTLKTYFTDPVFYSNLKAKSGSMTRVRSYAGYFTANSGKEMAFSILINNYTGASKYLISNIENLLKEIIISE